MLLHSHKGINYRLSAKLLHIFGFEVPKEFHVDYLNPPAAYQSVLFLHLSLYPAVELECPKTP